MYYNFEMSVSKNYILGSYNYLNFEEERNMMVSASKRKLELDNLHKKVEREIRLRFLALKYRFLRSSTKHKKDFCLRLLENMDIKNVIYVIHYLKMNLQVSKYEQALEPDFTKGKILIDHDRTMDKKILEETTEDDLEWLQTIDGVRQLGIILKLIGNCGNSLSRNIVFPCLRIYYTKLKSSQLQAPEPSSTIFESRPSQFTLLKPVDDSGMYTSQQSVEVEKLRHKWNEMISKYRNEIEFVRKKLPPVYLDKKKERIEADIKEESGQKKSKKRKNVEKRKKSKPGEHSHMKIEKEKYSDALQLLPVWIVKKIFNYLDRNTLIEIKKINAYWKYASDSVLKERKAIEERKAVIAKMETGLDPKWLNDTDDIDCQRLSKFKKSQGPTDRRIDRFMTRGANTSKIQVRPSKNLKKYTIKTQALMEDVKEEDEEFCYPFHKMTVFPRYTRDDFILYRSYKCPFKDINIYIDLDQDMRQYRKTLSYSLSEKLSELTFSDPSQMDLEGW